MDALNYIARYNAAKDIRTTWDVHFQEISDYAEPHNSSIITKKTAGGKRTSEIFDFTMALAKKRMASGFFSNLCPLNQQWFMLESENDELNKRDNIKRVYSELTQRLHAYIANNTTYTASLFSCFDSLGHIGTATTAQFTGLDSPAVCKHLHITGVYIEENIDGVIDTLYIHRELTPRQAAQEYGLDNLCNKIQAAYSDPKKTQEKFEFLQIIEPREKYDPDKLDPENMPWASIHIDIEGKNKIKTSGFSSKPFQVSRFYKATDELYGRSPAMLVFPECKQANKLREMVIKSAEKQIDPPVLVPSNFTEQIKTYPGALIPYNENSPATPKTLPSGRVDIGWEMIKESQQIIKEGFYLDLFMALDAYKQGDQKTAYEVGRIMEQVAGILAPIVGRFLSETFDGLIVRTLTLLFEAGYLNDIDWPEELAGTNFKIRYISKLAMALLSREVDESLDVLMKTVEYAKQTQDPSVLDIFNTDEIFKGIAQRRAMPTEFVRSKDEIAAIRQARNQAKQQADETEQLIAAANAVDMSKKPQAGSPAEQLLEAANV